MDRWASRRKTAISSSPSMKNSTMVSRVASRRNTAAVLHPENSTIVSLDLCFQTSPDSDTVITKSLVRQEQGAAAKTLDRIRLLCAPKPSKQAESAKKSAGKSVGKEELLAACPPVFVLGVSSDEEQDLKHSSIAGSYVELDASLSNSVFWRRARVLRIGAVEVSVHYNIPVITSITPPSKPFVGLPVVCANITTLFTTADDLYYEWCVKDVNADAAKDDLRVVSTNAVLVPTSELLGKTLTLRVTPDKETGVWTQVALPPVQMPPPPVERWSETTTRAEYPAFRVTTYNILYDGFCAARRSRMKIYPFATDEVLAIENRQVRILQELLACNTDIICLQECGKTLFNEFMYPALHACGFDGVYHNKMGSAQEGCGFFLRAERFELVETQLVPLNWSTIEKRTPETAAVIAEQHVGLKEALEHITSIATIFTLRERNTGKEVVVGNTHLFYHANACHIRILQTYIYLLTLQEASNAPCSNPSASSAEHTRPIVLCGDCNFTHTTGAYRLVSTGQVEAEHHSWQKGKLFYWGCDRQLGYNEDEAEELMAATDNKSGGGNSAETDAKKKAVTTSTSVAIATEGTDAESKAATVAEARPPLEKWYHTTLRAPFRLTDAYDRTDPSMPWTNYTMTFREVIDYIFFSEDTLDVLRTVPIPPESELSENYALPNAKYPSDHVALIADLAFKK